MGNIEAERKAIEKEIEDEKKIEDEIESKIRTLVKDRNKARLMPEKQQPARKKQKLENSRFISIRDTWGPPPPAAPKKNLIENDNWYGKK